jgi:hypothetical protein
MMVNGSPPTDRLVLHTPNGNVHFPWNGEGDGWPPPEKVWLVFDTDGKLLGLTTDPEGGYGFCSIGFARESASTMSETAPADANWFRGAVYKVDTSSVTPVEGSSDRVVPLADQDDAHAEESALKVLAMLQQEFERHGGSIDPNECFVCTEDTFPCQTHRTLKTVLELLGVEV